MMTFGQAVGELRTAQKSKRGVSLYSRFVNRPLGRLLAAAAYRARMTPNQVTAVSALVTALGLAVLIVFGPGIASGIVTAVLLVLGFALDSADGQVARLTRTSSPAGEWLDHVVDSGKIVAVHATVLVVVLLHGLAGPGWAWIPLAFQVVAIVTFAGGLLIELLKRASRAAGAPSASPSTAPPSTLRAIALLPADYGILAIAFVLWVWPPLFIVVYTLLFAANVIIALLLLVKWFRELSRPANP
ncbi:CDP-alcohol phosphatidyltransferase family protein [Leifsonia sp. RAF41]|uniref:CDP-alcohol phosphatidyltransferase family protein n=1 Tax=Leifsonia sp. RAF41 TaxID=3233056 RepID=UPI003F988C03